MVYARTRTFKGAWVSDAAQWQYKMCLKKGSVRASVTDRSWLRPSCANSALRKFTTNLISPFISSMPWVAHVKIQKWEGSGTARDQYGATISLNQRCQSSLGWAPPPNSQPSDPFVGTAAETSLIRRQRKARGRWAPQRSMTVGNRISCGK